jgi:hypothetical protein
MRSIAIAGTAAETACGLRIRLLRGMPMSTYSAGFRLSAEPAGRLAGTTAD